LTKVCSVYDLGLVDYREGLLLQEQLLNFRKSGAIADVLLLLQHPSVFTIGCSGVVENIIVPRETLVKEDIPVFHINRGGDVTYHGPGQLIGYPILNLREDGLTAHQYVWNLEEVAIRTLADFGIGGQRVSGRRGVWVGEEKVCALGLRGSGEVSTHGFALNVNTNLKYFTYIIPCGITGVSITSVSKLLGREVEIGEVQVNLLRHFSQVFKLNLEYRERLDEWLAPSSPSGLKEVPLTREAVKKLGLRHVVITSVTRDDLPDGGAYQFAKVVEAIRSHNSQISIEVLIPDFQGSLSALEVVVASFPSVINHNVETVPRLYSQVRPQADYKRSVQLLGHVKSMGGLLTKSGLMVGLGERRGEVIRVMEDLRGVDCDLLTIGQYLRPSPDHHDVVRFVSPAEFKEYEDAGMAMGFKGVASAPLVRSSFQADKMLKGIAHPRDDVGG